MFLRRLQRKSDCRKISSSPPPPFLLWFSVSVLSGFPLLPCCPPFVCPENSACLPLATHKCVAILHSFHGLARTFIICPSSASQKGSGAVPSCWYFYIGGGTAAKQTPTILAQPKKKKKIAQISPKMLNRIHFAYLLHLLPLDFDRISLGRYSCHFLYPLIARVIFVYEFLRLHWIARSKEQGARRKDPEPKSNCRGEKVENFKPTWNLFALIMPDSSQISRRCEKTEINLFRARPVKPLKSLHSLFGLGFKPTKRDQTVSLQSYIYFQ